MAQIQQNGSAVTGNYFEGTSTKNRGGSAITGGAASKTLNSRPVKGYNVGVFASTVVASNLLGNTKAVSAGTFAHSHVKPITARVTTEIAGVASTALLRTADTVTRSIHKIESVITNQTATAFRNGFNLFTGQYTSLVSTVTDNLGSDVAANPTSAVPGRLTYQLGKGRAVVTGYKAKTN